MSLREAASRCAAYDRTFRRRADVPRGARRLASRLGARRPSASWLESRRAVPIGFLTPTDAEVVRGTHQPRWRHWFAAPTPFSTGGFGSSAIRRSHVAARFGRRRPVHRLRLARSARKAAGLPRRAARRSEVDMGAQPVPGAPVCSLPRGYLTGDRPVRDVRRRASGARWIDAHPPGRGIAWSNGFEAGMRAISLAIDVRRPARLRRARRGRASSSALSRSGSTLGGSSATRRSGARPTTTASESSSGSSCIGSLAPELREVGALVGVGVELLLEQEAAIADPSGRNERGAGVRLPRLRTRSSPRRARACST